MLTRRRPDLPGRCVVWISARPEPSTKHFRSCETREVDTSTHVSDKFRRDRFEASKEPPRSSQRAQRAQWEVSSLKDFREEARKGPQLGRGGEGVRRTF